MKIGQKIIELRENQGLSQAALAEKININRSVLNRIELGTRPIRDNEIVEFAKFFNVSTDYLLGNEKAPDAHPDLPPLTPRDERNIAKEIEKILDGLDNSAALGGSIITDDEDLELLKSSLTQAVTLAKRVAKQKFTPKKYQKE